MDTIVSTYRALSQEYSNLNLLILAIAQRCNTDTDTVWEALHENKLI